MDSHKLVKVFRQYNVAGFATWTLYTQIFLVRSVLDMAYLFPETVDEGDSLYGLAQPHLVG